IILWSANPWPDSSKPEEERGDEGGETRENAAMNSPKAKERISEYVLVEPIGAGTFGQVWKAHHHIWKDQWVAIKVPTDTQYVRNLQKEGAAVHGLRQVNVVRALGLDPYADPPYFVMEFVDGPSLREIIKANPKGMSVTSAREILRGLLRALEH